VSQVGSQPKAAAYLRATETSNADILLGQAGQPLATRIARARPDHWLKNRGRRQAKGGFVGYGALEEHAVRQPIQAEGLREATRLRDRLGPDALDWSGFAAPPELEDLDRVETIQKALNLVEIVDTVVKASEIFPIKVLQTVVESGGRRLAVIRARPGSERDKIGKKIGLLETASALRRLFGEDHRDAARQWRISRSSDLGSSRYDDIVATFVDVVSHKGADGRLA